MAAEAEKTVSERSAQDKNRDILRMQGEAARLEQKKVASELEEKQLRDYMERFLPTIALSAAPVAMEMPAGVISDVIAFMDVTGLLSFLGFE